MIDMISAVRTDLPGDYHYGQQSQHDQGDPVEIDHRLEAEVVQHEHIQVQDI